MSALAQIERILDREAQRLLAEVDADPISTPTRSNNRPLNRSNDDLSPHLNTEALPIIGKVQHPSRAEAA